MNVFHFKDKEGEKFKIRAVFEESDGAGMATFYLERDFEQRRNVFGKVTQAQAEATPFFQQRVTLSELVMQPLEFRVRVSETSELELKYGIGSSNPGFYLKVGRRNFHRLPVLPLRDAKAEF